jgi:hypothetical protein
MLIVGSLPRAAQADERYCDDVGWGLAAVGVNLFYSPAKLVYAAIGGLVGGMAYVWTAGEPKAAHRVWSVSLGGTYVVTPAMLRGEESLLFMGETYGL